MILLIDYVQVTFSKNWQLMMFVYYSAGRKLKLFCIDFNPSKLKKKIRFVLELR